MHRTAESMTAVLKIPQNLRSLIQEATLNRLENLTRGKGGRPESSAVIQSRLNEMKVMESESKEKLEALLMKKARMPEDVHLDRQADDLVNSIKLAKAEIEDHPYRIAVLEGRLEEARARESAEREAFKDYQKSVPASEMKKKSMLLLKRLKSAQQTNLELLDLQRKRIRTEEITGKKINPVGVCGGFYSLSVILEFCEQENSGGGRKFVRWESIPFQKI